MGDFARRGFDLVFGHGGEFDAAAKQVAAKFPKTWFVVTNGNVSGTNIASMQINHWQVAFLGGVAAGMMTKSNKLALITAQKFKAMDDAYAGFRDGAKWVNLKVEATMSYTGDWDDVGKAKEAALAHIAKGPTSSLPTSTWPSRAESTRPGRRASSPSASWATSTRWRPRRSSRAPSRTSTSACSRSAKLAQGGKLQGKSYVIGVENEQGRRLRQVRRPGAPEGQGQGGRGQEDDAGRKAQAEVGDRRRRSPRAPRERTGPPARPRRMLEIDGITKTFGSLTANDRISFRVERGTVHALLGENGAGRAPS